MTDAASVLEAVWSSGAPAARAARIALSPLAALFGVAVGVRGTLYERGVFGVSRAPAAVISVGALRVGGSGKTPFVLWLAARLRERGRRPCLVTRGYGGQMGKAGKARQAPFLLDAGRAAQAEAAERAGDEAVLLALRSRVPVAVGANRIAACQLAARELAGTGEAPDVFVLDDGFQHRALARDLDVVLVSGDEASQRLLPAGPLRENVAALARADVVVSLAPEASGPQRGVVATSKSGASLCLRGSTIASCLVRDVREQEGESLAVLAGCRVVAVAAIARPERFLADLERAGARIAGTVLRRDHHRYDDADRREVEAAAAGADLVVCTEKDLVKLVHLGLAAPLRALRIEVRIQPDDEARLFGRAPFDR